MGTALTSATDPIAWKTETLIAVELASTSMEETLGTQSGRPEPHPRKDSLCAKPPTVAAELNSPGAEAKPAPLEAGRFRQQ